MTITRVGPKYNLFVQLPNGTVKDFPASRELIFPLQPDTQSFEIKTNPSKCPLPYDSINENYQFNYAEGHNGMNPLLAHLILLVLNFLTEAAI